MPIMGAFVEGRIQKPGGSEQELVFLDDGVLPDGIKDDGIYTTVFEPDMFGAYNISVQFTGLLGEANLTSRGASPAQVEGITPVLQPDEPVEEDFQRFAGLQVNFFSATYLPIVER
jgi:hypothetical protein